MSASVTGISWTDKTWNPVRGCSMISAGCTHCYAMAFAHRFGGPGQPYAGLTRQTSHGPVWTGEIRLIEKDIEAPLCWRKSTRIFVNSMSDLFHDGVSEWRLDQLFAVMALAHWHTFQVLTKRPDRMQAYLSDPDVHVRIATFAEEIISRRVDPLARISTDLRATYDDDVWPLPNVWMGVSVENVAALNRLNTLCETPAAIRFASFEPLLEDVHDITPWLQTCLNAAALDWCIIGGESGSKARPFELPWAIKLIEQCQANSVAVWMKQLGGNAHYRATPSGGHTWHTHYKTVDRHGANPDEWPEHLRVQQFPEKDMAS